MASAARELSCRPGLLATEDGAKRVAEDERSGSPKVDAPARSASGCKKLPSERAVCGHPGIETSLVRVMEDREIREVANFPAGPLDAKAEVGLFAVEKEPLIHEAWRSGAPPTARA